MAIQLTLPMGKSKRLKVFGGSFLKGNPRGPRILSTKHPMHLVLRSSHARGEHSFLRGHRQQIIRHILQRHAKNFGVTIYSYANAGNHLHLLVRAKNRRDFGRFLRAVAGIIARMTLKRERGPGGQRNKTKDRFWDARPFTRIVNWGRDFLGVKRYLIMNELEAVGFLPLRKKLYKELCSTA